MSSVLGYGQPETLPEFSPDAIPSADESVRRQVWSVLTGLYPRGRTPERRAVQRFPYPQLFYLTPIDEQNRPAGDSVAVIGKHLSERGIGFYHARPLPYRRMIASLEMPDAHWAAFLLDIKWCRFTQYGWYDSGGRFLQTMESPIVTREPERR
jgi:hypothetical protein